MKIVRFTSNGDQPAYGIQENDDVFAASGDLFTGLTKGDMVGSVGGVTLLAPVRPGKVVCIGHNYVAHVTERNPNQKLPEWPLVFMKPSSSVLDPGAPIEIAYPDNQTDYEAELVVVIGKQAKNVREADALDYVLGYTCGNDVSDRTFQDSDGQWVRAKGFDTYCPLGPCIETELDASDTQVTSRLNGQQRQSSSTSDMIFSIPHLIEFVTGIMTLEAGDVIMTGTPAGIGPMKAGDTIEVEVGGVGVLSNPVTNRNNA